MKQFTARHPWAILAAGAAIQILTGLPAAWGVFQQPVMDEFSLTEDGAGYAFGILIAAFGVGCVIGGFLQDKKGPRCAALWGTGLLCGGGERVQCLLGDVDAHMRAFRCLRSAFHFGWNCRNALSVLIGSQKSPSGRSSCHH